MNKDELSFNTQDYIQCFFDILDHMIQGMMDARISCSLSSTFINQMIPHHRGAIQMSKNLLQYTTDIPLQNIACRIISEQTKSIQDMLKIQSTCISYTNYQQDINQYLQSFQEISQNMFHEMSHAEIDNNINISFLHEMIPHHEGAVKMSKSILQYPICPELIPILNAIISSQEHGITEMKALLQKYHQ